MIENFVDFVFKFVIFGALVWFACGVRTDCNVTHVTFDRQAGMWLYTLNTLPSGAPYKIFSGVFLPTPPSEFLKIPFLRPIFPHDMDTLEFASLCASIHYAFLLLTATSDIVFVYGQLLSLVFISIYIIMFVYSLSHVKLSEWDLVEVFSDGYIIKLDSIQMFLEGKPPVDSGKILCGSLPGQKSWFEYSNRSHAILCNLKGCLHWTILLTLISGIQLILTFRGNI